MVNKHVKKSSKNKITKKDKTLKQIKHGFINEQL